MRDLQLNDWYPSADSSALMKKNQFKLFSFLAAPPCSAGLDIGIVLDKSDSVKEENLEKVIKFLKDLIEKFHPAPDADHFGFITFNNKANLVFNFANSEYHNKEDLLNKMESEPIKLDYGTRTDLALKLANNTLFTTAGGDRADKPNVMLVLTDGRPTCPKKKEKGKRAFNFKDFADNIAKDFEVCTLNLFLNIFCLDEKVIYFLDKDYKKVQGF